MKFLQIKKILFARVAVKNKTGYISEHGFFLHRDLGIAVVCFGTHVKNFVRSSQHLYIYRYMNWSFRPDALPHLYGGKPRIARYFSEALLLVYEYLLQQVRDVRAWLRREETRTAAAFLERGVCTKRADPRSTTVPISSRGQCTPTRSNEHQSPRRRLSQWLIRFICLFYILHSYHTQTHTCQRACIDSWICMYAQTLIIKELCQFRTNSKDLPNGSPQPFWLTVNLSIQLKPSRYNLL